MAGGQGVRRVSHQPREGGRPGNDHASASTTLFFYACAVHGLTQAQAFTRAAGRAARPQPTHARSHAPWHARATRALARRAKPKGLSRNSTPALPYRRAELLPPEPAPRGQRLDEPSRRGVVSGRPQRRSSDEAKPLPSKRVWPPASPRDGPPQLPLGARGGQRDGAGSAPSGGGPRRGSETWSHEQT